MAAASSAGHGDPADRLLPLLTGCQSKAVARRCTYTQTLATKLTRSFDEWASFRFRNSLLANGEWHRIVLDEHWQRAADADPPQPVEHCAKQEQDGQRAHRRSREWLWKYFRNAPTDREKRSGRDEQREAHSPQMPRQARPAARHAKPHDAHIASRRQHHDGCDEEEHRERD